MALQTATTSAGPAAQTDSNDNNDANDISHNSIPFSFLVAFLALFVAFMSIGLFARRILNYVRLQLGLPVPEPQQKSHRPKRSKPVLWDVHPERDMRTEAARWDEIKPLACYFLRQDTHEDAQEAPESPILHTYARTHIAQHTFVGTGRMNFTPLPPPIPLSSPTSPRSPHTSNHTTTRRGNRIVNDPMSFTLTDLRNLFRPPKHSTPSTENSAIEGLRVAVLVAMPSEERRCREKRASTSSSGSACGAGADGIEQLGEISLGMADVPWTGVEAVLDEQDEKT